MSLFYLTNLLHLNCKSVIEKGEFVAIVGPSGSGKSTLLHLLGGIDQPTSGRVQLYDTDIYALDQTQLAIFRRRQVGLIYQFYNLIPDLTVVENMTLPADLDGRTVATSELTELLATLGLTESKMLCQINCQAANSSALRLAGR